MTYPVALLIHTANLETVETLGTADAAGVKATTKTYTAISCRFGQLKQTYPNGESGDRVVRTPSCIVPATVSTVPGKLITGTSAPYTQRFRILTVRPAYVGPAGKTLSHYVLDLENVT